MLDEMIKHFVKDYENVENGAVRERYGIFASIISILCNLFLCAFKLLVGGISRSVSIQADAFNNLSDAGSNIATLFGFKLANKHPDIDHPYGHGRIEYITGMIIAFLILLVAFTSFKESITKMIHPEPVIFSVVTLTVLIGSILVKLWMGYFNKYIGKKIDSASLIAASQDSINDVISTLATVISVVFAYFSDFPLDGFMGFLVSIFVFRAGLEVLSDTMSPLLGQAPSANLVKDIHDFVMSYDGILGVHDMIVHDYGPSRLFVTLHAEVPADADILETHDQIDLIEREMNEKFGCLTTIHMDPVDINDPLTQKLKEMTSKVVKTINEQYTIHDFRIVSGPTHTNLIFDVVLPAEDRGHETELKKLIDKKIKEIDPSYFTVVNIDHSYV